MIIALVAALALSLGALAYPVVVGSHVLPILGNQTPPTKTQHPTTGDDNGTANGNDTDKENETSEAPEANETQNDQGEANDTSDMNETSDANETSDMNETSDANETSDLNETDNDTADAVTMSSLTVLPDLAMGSMSVLSGIPSSLALLAPVEAITNVLAPWTAEMAALGTAAVASVGL